MLAYDLDYTADAPCPERGAFVAWVDAQLHEARETAPGARARAVVLLQQGPAGASARLELTREDGTRYSRELGGESCEAAAQGLAFVLAYALGGGDPLDAPLPEIPPKPADPAPAPPVETPPPEPTLPSASAPPATPAAAVQQPSRWRFGFAAQLGARTGLGPIWTPVVAGLVDVRRRKSGIAPVLRLAVLRGEPIRRVEAFGTTELSWLAARVEGCPVQVPLVGALQLAPCAGLHLGRISAQGTPSGNQGTGQRANEPWADVALALRLELDLWRLLQLEVQGEALFPLTPYQFAFDNPNTSVYQVPSLAFAGFLGLGLHFP